MCLHVEHNELGPAVPTVEELRLLWCNANLGTAQARIDFGRLPWPEGELGPGDPDHFEGPIERALVGCDGKIAATDCTEYPCLAVLKANNPKRLKQDCEPRFRDLYGDGGGVEIVPTRCPDGRIVRVPVAYAGEASIFEKRAASLLDSDEPDRWMSELAIVGRIWSRRVDDALALADVCRTQ